MAITAEHPRSSTSRPRLSAKEDLLTIAFGTWLLVGLFVDGWAHNNDKPETFFTPWHGLFYSGFVATALWMLSRYQRHGAVPVGYGLGYAGLALFAAGGLADMAWHMAFGVEVEIEALLSPTHLALFVSGALIMTSPLRAAWSKVGDDPSPSLRGFLPPLLSTTMLTATAAFFHMHFSPFLTWSMTAGPYRYATTELDLDTGGWISEKLQLEGLASVLFTTLILIAPALMLLRRWRLPTGSLTFLFTAVGVLVTSLWGSSWARPSSPPSSPGSPPTCWSRGCKGRGLRPPSCGRSAPAFPWSCGWATSPSWPSSTAWGGRSTCGSGSPSCRASPATRWPC